MTVDARFNSRVIRISDYPEIGYQMSKSTLAAYVCLALATVCLTVQSNAQSIPTTMDGFRVLGSTVSPESTLIEMRLQQEADSLSGPVAFAAQVVDSFTSGGNIGYSAGRFVYRKFATGPTDIEFDQAAYIEEYSDRIPFALHSAFMGTKNRSEADWLLSDIEDAAWKRRLIEARGAVTGKVAWLIASGIAPVAVLSVFVLWMANSRRRMPALA